VSPLESRAAEQRLRQRLAAKSRRLLHARNNPGTRETVVAELERQERDLVIALEDLSRQRDPAPQDPPLSAGQIQAALGAGDVLLEYHVVGDEMFVWAVTRNMVQLQVLPVTMNSLTNLVLDAVASYHSDEHRAEDSAEDRDAVWQELRRIVLEPVADLTTQAETLYVSPAGQLHFISFEPMIDGPVIVYIPSATISFQPPSPRPGRPHEADFVGFGNPAFDPALPEFAGLAPIPGAEGEVEEIAGLFGQRGLALCGSRATEGELRFWSRRCRYLHVAAHGLVDIDNPMRSGVVFASSAVPAMLDGSSPDDILHAYEMVNLEIAAELVVIAACRTGFGTERAGEGLTTIGSALLQGGAQWVLVTLWPVGDLVSINFMRLMYEAIREGTAIPKAVKIARDEIRADHSDPYWWAGFVLLGVRA
jgi:CHAT domain-containing protein